MRKVGAGWFLRGVTNFVIIFEVISRWGSPHTPEGKDHSRVSCEQPRLAFPCLSEVGLGDREQGKTRYLILILQPQVHVQDMRTWTYNWHLKQNPGEVPRGSLVSVDNQTLKRFHGQERIFMYSSPCWERVWRSHNRTISTHTRLVLC